MSTSIAFLSGKGGSGKTTLALSMADLLSRCGIRTLLVDCDMSTNGATYFYESLFADQRKPISNSVASFFDLLTSDWYEDNTIFISVTENLSFFPSVVDFSSRPSDKTVHYKSDDFSQLQSFIHYAQNTFDVILYDCQAGYTEVLPSLLPQVDVALFVLEADSISASAMRSLHLKIGNHLHAAHLYQVFNKATPEEFETYSKIVGTFFTNIGTFLFDWKIRQAFSRSQIPDLENTSASFGIDLCNICKVMIPERVLNEKLDSFSSHLKLQQLEEKKGQLEDKLKHLSSKTRLSSRILFPIALSMISLIAVLAIPTSIDRFKSISAETLYNTLTALIVVVFLILFLVSVPYTLRSTLQEDRKERLKYERELNNLEKSIKKLEVKVNNKN